MEQKELTTEARNALELLASGYSFRRDTDGFGGELVKHGMDIDSTTFNELVLAGFVDGTPNGMAARISDKGKRAYIKSTDEMGDGKVYAGD